MSEKIQASLVEIEEKWSLLDLAQAHELLDMIEDQLEEEKKKWQHH